MIIAPIWERFLSSYPEVNLELSVESAPIDLASIGFDAGVAVRSRIPSEAIAIRASDSIQVAVGGRRGYLAKILMPGAPEDLAAPLFAAFWPFPGAARPPWNLYPNRCNNPLTHHPPP